MYSHKILVLAAILLALLISAFFLGKFVGTKMGRPEYLPDKATIGVTLDTPEDSGLMAVVIDDMGYSLKNLENIKKMGVPITLAVLPNLRYSEYISETAGTAGLEVILHLPMEPSATKWAREKNTVMAGMDRNEVELILREALVSIPGASGVSNHMGSRATGDEMAAMSLMRALKKRGLFFLDSFTSASSVCEKAARSSGVTYLRRDVFIDNDPRKSLVKQRLMEAGNIALKKGTAIAIGHDRELTVSAVMEAIPELKKMGIRFASLKELAGTMSK